MVDTRIQKGSLTDQVLGLAIEVHKTLGPGLLESAYEECLCYELGQAGLNHNRQVHLPVVYKGIKLECGYRVDIVVEDSLIIEVKAVNAMQPIYEAQILTYLKLTGIKTGLLINFNVPLLKDGIKRIVC